MQGNYKKAEEILLNVAEHFKENNVNDLAAVYLNIGDAYLRQHKGDYGESYFKKTIEIDPKCASAYNGLGRIYYRRGNLDKAEDCFKECLVHDKQYTRACCNLGMTYTDKENYAEAKLLFEKALTLSDAARDILLAKFDRGNMYKKQGLLEDAIKDYEDVVALDKDHMEPYIELKDAYVKNGDNDKATECQQQIDRLYANNVLKTVSGERDKIGLEQLNQQHERARVNRRQDRDAVKMNVKPEKPPRDERPTKSL